MATNLIKKNALLDAQTLVSSTCPCCKREHNLALEGASGGAFFQFCTVTGGYALYREEVEVQFFSRADLEECSPWADPQDEVDEVEEDRLFLLYEKSKVSP